MFKKNSMDYKKQSRKNFDEEAGIYYETHDGRHSKALYDLMITKLNSLDYSSLLDVGFGTGEVLSRVSQEDVQFSGLDISPQMLSIARENLGESVDLRLGDSEELPWNDESFDVVMCLNSFHHYPNPEKVLNEMGRVLKTGGKIVMADPWQSTPFRQIMNLFIRFNGGGDVKIYSESEICDLLSRSGFKNIEWEKANKNAFIVTANI
ncbi:MAG: class I SAM-dependent methyltransferase [Methanobacterium paludis]|nr:class I SAM-dependent methyltransferase [Methanobacterium paludis]